MAEAVVEDVLALPALSFYELKKLDNLLRCEICFDYIKNCVITSCCHSYCSLCIRQYMSYKCQCPKCFEETTEGQLRTNRLVDDIIFSYLQLRDKLVEAEEATSQKSHLSPLVSRLQVQNISKTIPSPDTTSTYKPLNLSQDTTSMYKPLNLMQEKPVCSKEKKPAAKSIEKLFSPSKASGSQNSQPEPGGIKRVTCPVCNVSISERTINLHLDKCLMQNEAPCKATRAENKSRKPLPKLVYSLLNEANLRKKLKEIGLNAKGDKKILMWRHQRYTILYNSECDSLNPKSAAEILKQVELEEKNMASSSAGVQGRLQVDRRVDPKIIEEKQKEYLDQHRSQFQQLVQDVKKRSENCSKEVESPQDEETKLEADDAINNDSDHDSRDLPLSSSDDESFPNPSQIANTSSYFTTQASENQLQTSAVDLTQEDSLDQFDLRHGLKKRKMVPYVDKKTLQLRKR